MTPDEERLMRALMAQGQGAQMPQQMSGVTPSMTAAMRGNMPPAPESAAYDASADAAKVKRMQGIANQLRGAKAQGKTVGPSGIYVGPNWGEVVGAGMQQLGAGMMDRNANQELDRIGGLQQAAAKEAAAQKAAKEAADTARADKSLELQGQRVDLEGKRLDQAITESEQRTAERADEAKARVDAAELAHQREIELINLKAENDVEKAKLLAELENSGTTGLIDEGSGFSKEQVNAINGLKDATARKAATTQLNTVNNLNEAMRLGNEVIANGGSWTGGGKRLVSGIAGSIGSALGGDEGGLAASGKADEIMYNKDEKAVRGQIDRSVQDFLRSEAGANLTAMERVLGKNWNPSEADSEEEAMRRMGLLANYMNSQLSSRGIPQVEVWQPEEKDQQRVTPKTRGGIKQNQAEAPAQSMDDLDAQIKALEEELRAAG